MISFILSLFRPFRTVIERTGADYYQFITILKLRLTIDGRKSRKSHTSSNMGLVLQSVVQLFIGFIIAISFIMIRSEFTFYYLMHSIIMVMMSMMIISEFTTILFDTSENSIIIPLPVKGNTLSLARNVHILLYLLLIAFSLSIPALIIGVFKFGIISGVVFLFSIILNVTFTLFIANILYLVLMQMASGERLKNIMMYIQICIAILFMGAYQFGTILIDKTHIADLTLPIYWYTHFIPPAIFAGLVETFSISVFDFQHLLFVVESLLIPICSLWITTRFLTPVFNQKLLYLSGGSELNVKKTVKTTSYYYRLMEFLFTRNKEERAAFKLVWYMSGNERLFKQSFFPSLAYIVILIVVQFTRSGTSVEQLIGSSKYFIALYSFLLISFTLTSTIVLGDNHNVGWLFKVLPVETPAEYFKGFIKSAFVRFFNPFYFVISIVIVVLWGVAVIPDIIIAWLTIYLCTLLLFYIQSPQFPFSHPKATNQGGANFAKIFGLILLSVMLGFIHYLLNKWDIYGRLSLVIFYTIGIVIVNRVIVYKLLRWDRIEIAES